MNLEMTLLRMLSDRESWSKLRGAVPRGGLEEKTKQIAGRIGEYYKAFPDVTRVEADPFLTWYFGTVKTNADAETKTLWRNIAQDMSEPVPPDLAKGMFDKLLTLGSASVLGDVLNRYVEGEDVDLIAELNRVLTDFKSSRRQKAEDIIVNSDVTDLLDASENHVGITWPLDVFNEHMRPLAAGDFVGICARPDNGKTTVVTFCLSHFLPQIPKVFGEERPVLWFCNEGDPRKIWLRMYQSILNMSMTELGKFRREQCKGDNQKFLDEVFSKIGGRGSLHIINASKLTNIDVEEHIENYNPAIVVYDMIDNITFNGLTMHGGTRTDQVLESMYQWARELAVSTEHIAIATSQISGEGEGLAFPAKSMLKDSKTGKQGTFDVQLMLGASNSNGMQDVRYFSTPKNKLRVDGSPSNMQVETVFDSSRGRFISGVRTKYVPPEEQEEIAEGGKIAEAVTKRKEAKHDPLGED